jgi:hypothetical protein
MNMEFLSICPCLVLFKYIVLNSKRTELGITGKNRTLALLPWHFV